MWPKHKKYKQVSTLAHKAKAKAKAAINQVAQVVLTLRLTRPTRPYYR
jgi:hypothetical protein